MSKSRLTEMGSSSSYSSMEDRKCKVNLDTLSEKLKEETLTLLREKKIDIEIGIYDSHDINPTSRKNTIVFVHGLASSKNIFIKSGLVAHYESLGFRVIALDLLGHGQSSKINKMPLEKDQMKILAKDLYRYEILAAMIQQLLKTRDIHSAQVIGWSIGGLISTVLAIKSSLVASLVTISSPPIEETETSRSFAHPKPNFDPRNPQSVGQYNGIPDIEGDNRFFLQDMSCMDPFFMELFRNPRRFNAKAYVQTAHIPILMFTTLNDSGINYCYYLTNLTHSGSQIDLKKEYSTRYMYVDSSMNELRYQGPKIYILESGGHCFFMNNRNVLLSAVDKLYMTLGLIDNKPLTLVSNSLFSAETETKTAKHSPFIKSRL